MIGKEIRLKRLIPGTDGKYFGLTVDHAIARGVMPGLDTIDDTLSKMVAGGPNAITMHKGIAEKCFAPYAGKVALVLKLTTFGVYHFDEDVQVADVEEGLLRMLGRISKEALRAEMPLICHIYPRGNHITGADQYSVENVTYAARAAAELGVDLIKTNYTGDLDSFAKVVQAVPARVAIAGGLKCETVKEYLQMTRNVMDAGAAGVTYGRFVFRYRDITALVKTLSQVIHNGISVQEGLELLEYLEREHQKGGEPCT